MKESDYLTENNSIVQRLKTLPILQTYDEEDINELLPFSKIREYEDGEQIMKEGDDEDKYIYFLLSGKVSVQKDDIEIYQLHHAGDIFGEIAVIEKRARSASIYALVKTLCLAVDAAYTDMLAKEEKIAFLYILIRIFCETMAKRLRETSDELITARKRIKELEGQRT